MRFAPVSARLHPRPTAHIFVMYRFDTSFRGIAFPATLTNANRRNGGASGRGRSPVRSARTGSARVAARHTHARLRAAQAPERPARSVPRLRIWLALPLPEGPAGPGTDRGRAARPGGEAAGRRAPFQDRLPADRGGQGTAAAASGRARPGRVGGRRVRRPVRLLRPDPRGHPAADSGRRRTRLEERLDGVRAAMARTRERLDSYTLELHRHGLESVEREVRWLNELIASERQSSGEPSRHAAQQDAVPHSENETSAGDSAD